MARYPFQESFVKSVFIVFLKKTGCREVFIWTQDEVAKSRPIVMIFYWRYLSVYLKGIVKFF